MRLKSGLYADSYNMSAVVKKEPNYFQEHLLQLNKFFEYFKYECITRRSFKRMVHMLQEYYGNSAKVRLAWFSNKIKVTFEVTAYD